ncbi:MAG: hypothetical protein L3K04_05090 [Thermoplasmata archaeon]|jgi:hypothetical protein|nr:hypothetical protein [Thermoplasmata archaeon]MCI4341116.1 hypothetical protein [Thermoplasmata archaeon]
MVHLSETRLGYGFGLLGGSLLLLGGLVSLVVGFVDLVVGHPFGAISSAGLAVVLFVVGALAIFFAWLAHHDWSDRPTAGGVLLVVLAVIGWAFLGLGANVVALIGALFVFLGGVLFLVEPAKRVALAAATA